MANIKKSELLKEQIEHIDITKFDARPIIDAYSKMAFSARDLARASDIYDRMLAEKECSVILCVAGSLFSAGLKKAVWQMVESNMVDAIVSTGANIVDQDFFEALGFKHYKGSKWADDKSLRAARVDRIYDTYIDEEELQHVDHTIYAICEQLEPRPYTSREFIYEIGKWLAAGNAKKKDSLIQRAYEKGVPIFVPAFSDCSAGFGLVKHQVERRKAKKPYVTIDSAGDFRELTEIKLAAGTTALFMVGGGVPKNFAQDTVVCAEILGHDDVEVHKYAVQITVADVRDGACSSSTLQEAASWGKVSTVHEQMVFAEATSVAPIIVSDAYHRGGWRKRAARNWAKLFK